MGLELTSAYYPSLCLSKVGRMWPSIHWIYVGVRVLRVRQSPLIWKPWRIRHGFIANNGRVMLRIIHLEQQSIDLWSSTRLFPWAESPPRVLLSVACRSFIRFEVFRSSYNGIAISWQGKGGLKERCMSVQGCLSDGELEKKQLSWWWQVASHHHGNQT